MVNHHFGIRETVFGTTPTGATVKEFELVNNLGTRVKVINWGGVITECWTHDKRGNLGNIVLGFDGLDMYLENSPYCGALVGRVCNRIANAAFELDGVRYPLVANNGSNNLHAGPQGFEKKLWQARSFDNDSGPGVVLSLLSEDGDQGFPGNLSVTVVYQLTHDNQLITDFHATTDKPTPVNMTQHSYFNLACSGDILDHQLQIFSDFYTAVDSVQIPLGSVAPVAGTPFDFREPHCVGERIATEHEQLRICRGYDHHYVIRQSHTKAMTLAARVEEQSSGRILEVFTQEPGVQFYSGNYLDHSLQDKNRYFGARTGFCLEPQHFPDSPNQRQFPSVILHPGEEYKTRTAFKFSVSK